VLEAFWLPGWLTFLCWHPYFKELQKERIKCLVCLFVLFSFVLFVCSMEGQTENSKQCGLNSHLVPNIICSPVCKILFNQLGHYSQTSTVTTLRSTGKVHVSFVWAVPSTVMIVALLGVQVWICLYSILYFALKRYCLFWIYLVFLWWKLTTPNVQYVAEMLDSPKAAI
jgi:NADH:ubiquinone oxidoreductase subunit 5 (subunit L)/multisubunit Na+/H+ antiporter MnhA subunit